MLLGQGNAGVPASTAYSVNVSVKFDGRSKYYDFDVDYPPQLEGILSVKEFKSIGKMLKDAVETASKAEHEAWAAQQQFRTACGRRFMMACMALCAAAVVVLLVLFLGTPTGRHFSLRHLSNPLFVVGILAVVLAVALAAVGNTMLRRPRRVFKPCQCGVRTLYSKFRRRVNSAFHDAVQQMSDSLSVRQIVVKHRLVFTKRTLAPRDSSQSMGNNRIVPMVESDIESNIGSGTMTEEMVTDGPGLQWTPDSFASGEQTIEWLEFQLPAKAARPAVVPTDPNLIVCSSAGDVAADAAALREAARLLFEDRVPEAHEVLETIVAPGLDTQLHGVRIRPLRLVGVAMLSHAFSRYAPLFRGRQFKFYPCTALTREIRRYPSLVAPALAFLDGEIPILGQLSPAQAVFCFIRASVTFNTPTASSPFDFDTALPFYDRAAGGGYDFAESVIAMYYKSGWSGFPRDPVRAADMWRHLSAVTGRKSACRMYGECLLKGEGVRTDFTLGIRLIREAAEWGDGPSMVHVGEMAIKEGTPASTQRAVEYFKLAAAMGLPRAQYLYGHLLDVGVEGLTPDAAAAMELLKFAAMQDDKDARRVLEEKQTAGRRSKGKLARSRTAPQGLRGGDEAKAGPVNDGSDAGPVAVQMSQQSGPEFHRSAQSHSDVFTVRTAAPLAPLQAPLSSVAAAMSSEEDPRPSDHSGHSINSLNAGSSAGIIVPRARTLTSPVVEVPSPLQPLDGDPLQQKRPRRSSAFRSPASVKSKSRSHSSHEPGDAVVVTVASNQSEKVKATVAAAGDVTDVSESELGVMTPRK